MTSEEVGSSWRLLVLSSGQQAFNTAQRSNTVKSAVVTLKVTVVVTVVVTLK
jgi:hypothetical protein